MLLGPSVEVVEDPRELAAAATQAIAAAGIALQHSGVDEFPQPGGENRGADSGALAQLGEGARAPSDLPDQPECPPPSEQLQNALHRPLRRHWYGFRRS